MHEIPFTEITEVVLSSLQSIAIGLFALHVGIEASGITQGMRYGENTKKAVSIIKHRVKDALFERRRMRRLKDMRRRLPKRK